MSSPDSEDERPDLAARARLEAMVGRLVDQLRHHRERGDRAESRVRDLEGLLARFARGEEDPARLALRLDELRQENLELRERMKEGREGVDRLLSRVRYLDEHGG